MRALPLAAAFVVATGLGLGLTWMAVTTSRGMDTVRAGAWEGWPRAGTTQADPYARAFIARSAELPLELADGLMFLARQDSDGKPLDGRCDIRISGKLPQARLWTLTVMDGKGHLIENDAQRHGFTSSEPVYTPAGDMDVVLSPRARPGNWVPSGGRAEVQVALRLYDAPFSFASSTVDAGLLPRIATVSCP
ncbi:DUF1214 domain-containing protein [Xanthobacteraceae bacterium A53D]